MRLCVSILFGCLLAASWSAASAQTAPLSNVAEFAPVDEVLLGCNDSYLVLDAYKEIIAGLGGSVKISIICPSRTVANELRYEFTYDQIDLTNVKFYLAPIDSVWMRDYGPNFARDAAGKVVVVDTNYFYDRPNDDAFVKKWAAFRAFPVVYADVDMEGGNLMADGRGTIMTSNILYPVNSRYSTTSLRSLMKSKVGATRWSTVKPLIDEGTGHIDMFAKFMNGTSALVAAFPSGHKNYATLESNAAYLRSLGYAVTRVPMADADISTHVNSLIVNDRALVPVYRKPTDALALSTHSRFGYRAVGVDCRLLIDYGGAVHCISYGVPRR